MTRIVCAVWINVVRSAHRGALTMARDSTSFSVTPMPLNTAWLNNTVNCGFWLDGMSNRVMFARDSVMLAVNGGGGDRDRVALAVKLGDSVSATTSVAVSANKRKRVAPATRPKCSPLPFGGLDGPMKEAVKWGV